MKESLVLIKKFSENLNDGPRNIKEGDFSTAVKSLDCTN